MRRLAILKPTQLPNAKALLEELGIAHHLDRRETVFWIHDANEAERAAKFLRERHVNAVTVF